MSWEVEYLPEVDEDLKKIDGSQIKMIYKAINKVSLNPMPNYLGGYGKPLGNHNTADLSGFCKIKLKSIGLRIVYKTIVTDTKMVIIVIGAREDEEVYEEALKRILKHKL